MIDDKFMKRIQSAVNRDKNLTRLNTKVSLPEVREYIYDNWANATTKDEPSIVSGLITQMVNESSKLAVVEDEDKEVTSIDLSGNTQSSMSNPPQQAGAISLKKEEFIQLAEQEFGNEPQEIKDEIVNHLLSQSIRSARGLRSALAQIRNTELNLFRKTYSDHLASRRAELNALRQSLQSKAQEEESDEVKFQNQLAQTLDSYIQEFGLV